METVRDGSVDIWGKPALRRTTGGFKRAFFILVNQALVSVGLTGASANLVVYLTDVLRQGASSAASNTSNWQGAAYFFAVLGGFVGDAYLGRYKAALLFQTLGVLGIVLLSVAATIPSLHSAPSCRGSGGGDECTSATAEAATRIELRVFYAAIYAVALGFGCNVPNIVSFGGDQFEDSSSTGFFQCFYAAMMLGTLAGSLGLVYVENEGRWASAFWASAASSALGLLALLAPARAFRFRKAGGNPLLRAARVVAASIRKRAAPLPPDSSSLYETDHLSPIAAGGRKLVHTVALRCLDKAAIILPGELAPDVEENNSKNNDDDDSSSSNSSNNNSNCRSSNNNNNNNNNHNNKGIAIVPDPWRLCTVTQVEEVKWLVRVVPVWLCTILFTTAYTQVFSLFVIQGSNMETRVGSFDIPPASLYAVDCVSVVLCIAAYEYWVRPQQQGLGALQRIGLGMPIVALAMLEAGILEMIRLRKLEIGGANVSVLWQLPQYITTGMSETFTYIGQIHFFYDQAPDAMRSIGSALTPASVALGNYANVLLVLVVGKLTGSPGWIPESGSIDTGHLDYFFFMLAALALANFGLFSVVSMRYRSTERHAILPSPPT